MQKKEEDLQPYKEADYFRIVGIDRRIGDSGVIKQYRDLNLPLRKNRLFGIAGLTIYADTYYTQSIDYAQLGGVGSICIDYLEPMSKEEAEGIIEELYTKRKKVTDDFIVSLDLKAKKSYKNCFIPKVKEKWLLNTNYNYLTLFTRQNELEIPKNTGSENALAVCCALTKCTHNILIQIPVLWAKYFGYNEKLIKEYLEFLQEMDIGFEAAYLERGKYFGSNFEIISPVVINKQNNFFIPKNEFYKIMLKGATHSMVTYCHFITIRYLYNNQYWNIPLTAMQMKHCLGDKVTNLEAFIMSHSKELYYNYYNWYSHTETRIPDPFINFNKDVLPILRKNENSLNVSFKYINASVEEASNLKKAWETNDYEKIFEIFSKYKK